jgi:penicillin-binding protein 1A
MGGKTGTTNDNADAWFMGYTPQLLGGVWIGCDDRFIRIENGLGYGGQAARPIWEKFFQKVYADKTLGIDRDARFVQPADYDNQINSAQEMPTLPTGDPLDQGDDQTVKEEDYMNNEFIGPESKPVIDDDKPTKRDSLNKNNEKKPIENKPIGSAADEPKKKKGILNKIFGKKDKS